MTRNGNPITEVRLKNSINTGIAFGDQMGCISEFEEMSACHAGNYTYYGTWQELTEEQKAREIAHHMLSILVNNHQQDAQAVESKKRK